MFLFRDFTLDPNQEIRVALQSVFGINWRKSIYIVSRIGLGYPLFLSNLNMYNYSLIIFLLKGLLISDVRIKRRVSMNIALMVNNKSYIGNRHLLCLPVHGQRTRTNANTQRSKRIRSSRSKI